MLRPIALILFVGLCVVYTSAVHAAERVALVIGNGKYQHAGELPNPRNDAEDMGATLEGLGFEVIQGIDLDRDGMEAKIRAFAQAVKQAKLALFFYAGHGMQVNGRNFLIPIDAELADSTALDWEAIDADKVFQHMGSAERVALAFLDACRDNPLARRFARTLGAARSAAIGRGLAPPTGAGGLFVAFATAPNDVALDGEGRNSPFTTALLKHLPSEGLEIQRMMTRVKAEVWEMTNYEQRPWHSSDLGTDVYLLPKTAEIDPHQQVPSPVRPDELLWLTIKDSTVSALFDEFLQKFPDSPRRPLAEKRLAALGQPPVDTEELDETESERQTEIEQTFWNSIKEHDNPAYYREYLAAYPAGLFAAVARQRLEELEAQSEKFRDGSYLQRSFKPARIVQLRQAVQVWNKPAADATALATARNGDELVVLGTVGDDHWFKVVTGSMGQIGYVPAIALAEASGTQLAQLQTRDFAPAATMEGVIELFSSETARVAAAEATGRFGAVVQDGKTSFYAVWSHSSLESAEQAVKARCASCQVHFVYPKSCFALYRSKRSGWAWAIDKGITTAMNKASANCRKKNGSCWKSMTFCGDGSNHFSQ